LQAQCFFFSAVYLMHTFRPFAAWPLFLQAMACCQAFQCCSQESTELFPAGFVEDGAGWRSEESMYWTCFKSEMYVRYFPRVSNLVSIELTLRVREQRASI
jgi:hypothetical protein